MKTMMKAALAAGLTCLAFLPAALEAQETPHAGYRETGAVKDWVGIYSPNRGSQARSSVCAIYSRPTEAVVFDDNRRIEVMRGEIAAFLSWNSDLPTDASGELSFMMGLPVVKGSDEGHMLTINGKSSFELVGVGDRLYVRPEDDAAVVSALRGGREMVVTAKTSEGHVVKDSYSLYGVQATTEISKTACR